MDLWGRIPPVLEEIAGLLWGWPMLIVLVGTGAWLTWLLRGVQFRMLGAALWDALGPQKKDFRADGTEGAISNRAALWTALAATVGTGNIAGVATAIAMGGPGAMFWMWVSGLLGMALKYAEVLLGVYHRVQVVDHHGNKVWRGGPMYYLSQGVGGRTGTVLAMMFATFLAFAALSIGGMVQTNSVADAMNSAFGLNPTLVGGLMVAGAGVIMLGGLQKIAQVAEVLVPVKIGVYVLAGSAILILNMGTVPELFAAIFRDAFTGTAAAGGFAGAAVMQVMRYGLARGVFANESGLGSAPIVSATARTKHPAEQALIGMTQTFLDTFLVCTFTGLVILVTGAWLDASTQSAGAALTTSAFNTGLGNLALGGVQVGGTIVSVCLLLFAFTTMLGWGYYGQQGIVYVLGPRAATPYLMFFLLCCFFGAFVLDLASSVRSGVQLVWTIADIATGLMMLPNLLALWLLSGRVKRLTADYLAHRYRGEELREQAFYNQQ